MLFEIEKITSIERRSNGKVTVYFHPNERLDIHTRRQVIPLLMLLKYETCTCQDLEGPKVNELLNSIPKDVDVSDILVQPSYYVKGLQEIVESSKYNFIESRNINGVKTYIMPKECHEYLSERIKSMTEVEKIGYDLKELLEKQENRCNICKMSLKEDECTVDFRIPRLRGGQPIKENLHVLCKACFTNKKKICFGCIQPCTGDCKLSYPEKSNVILGLL